MKLYTIICVYVAEKGCHQSTSPEGYKSFEAAQRFILTRYPEPKRLTDWIYVSINSDAENIGAYDSPATIYKIVEVDIR